MLYGRYQRSLFWNIDAWLFLVSNSDFDFFLKNCQPIGFETLRWLYLVLSYYARIVHSYTILSFPRYMHVLYHLKIFWMLISIIAIIAMINVTLSISVQKLSFSSFWIRSCSYLDSAVWKACSSRLIDFFISILRKRRL